MATKLDKELRRELEIDGTTYTLVVGPSGLRLTGKRMRRAALERTWPELLKLPETNPK